MKRTELLDFAKASALAALDNGDGFSDPVASYRENLIDTMADEKVSSVSDYLAAVDLYDRLVREGVHAQADGMPFDPDGGVAGDEFPEARRFAGA